MRTSGLLFAALCVACCHVGSAYGQAGEPRGPEEPLESYHKHHDTRHGHDHVYPDRGAIVRDVPQGAVVVNYAGLSYRFHDGVWFEPRGPAFMVVAPPIGLIVPTLPAFTTLLAHGGGIYLYCNDTYYRPKPDLSGYEVINDPAETAAKAPAATVAPGGAAPGGTAVTAPAPGAAVMVGPPAPAIVSEDADGPPPIVSAAPMPTATAATAPPAAAMKIAVPAVMTPAAGPTPAIAVSGAPAVSASTPVASGSIVGPVAAPASMQVASATAGTTYAPASTQAAAGPPAVPGSGAVASVPAAAAMVPVALPATPAQTPPTSPKGVRAGLTPKNNQSAEQVAHDRYDCYRFAVSQSGFDPIRTNISVSQATLEAQSNYERAQVACFEGRGYTVQ